MKPAVEAGAERSPPSVRVKPARFTDAPVCTVSALIWWLAPTTGLLGVPGGMIASPVMPGPPPPVQLAGFSQLASAAPVQVCTLPVAGQLITAPLAETLCPPSVAGVGLTRSTVSAPLLPAPSVSVALR